MADNLIEYIRHIYNTNDFIPLHKPSFKEIDTQYVLNTMESGFVSSVGEYVDEFEDSLKRYTGCGKAVATVNGTAAIQAALYVSGIKPGDIVLTQALTFVASCNVLKHMGLTPALIDVSFKTLGMCPKALELFLDENATLDVHGCAIYKNTGQKIHSVMPMHTFGHPVELDDIKRVCKKWNLLLIEDSAESLGSYYKGQHTGTFGDYGILSFNGNKIITTGGGGAVLCQSEALGKRLRHVTSTAKVPHPYEYYHDEAGFNFRMPNLNAALGCSQMLSLGEFLNKKRELAGMYRRYFEPTEYEFFMEPDHAKSNYWLNAVICPNKKSRDELLEKTNKKGVMTRPVWTLMHKLPAFKQAIYSDLSNSEKLEELLVNIPSTPI